MMSAKEDVQTRLVELCHYLSRNPINRKEYRDAAEFWAITIQSAYHRAVSASQDPLGDSNESADRILLAREMYEGLGDAQSCAPVAQVVAKELWETIKILGLSNEQFALQAINRALASHAQGEA